MSAQTKVKQALDVTRIKVKEGTTRVTDMMAGHKSHEPAVESKAGNLSARARHAGQRGTAALKHAAGAATGKFQETMNSRRGSKRPRDDSRAEKAKHAVDVATGKAKSIAARATGKKRVGAEAETERHSSRVKPAERRSRGRHKHP